MSVVYLVQEDPKKNVVGALDWGSMEVLLRVQDNPSPTNMPDIVARIEYGLREYTADDWLVLLGSPIAIAVAGAIAASRTGGKVKFLKWDNQERRYFPAVMDLATTRAAMR